MLMISPIPFVNYQFIDTYYDRDLGHIVTEHVQYLDDYIAAAMFICRIYFLFKSRFNYSNYRDPFSKQICKEHNFYPSNWFIFKVKNEKKPLKTVILTSVSIIFGIWWWLLLFELQTFVTSNATSTVSPEYASLYLTMITMTTVGFGDITPQT